MTRAKSAMTTLTHDDLRNDAEARRPPGFFARLHEDVACVFAREPAARNVLELVTIYPGVHAILSHRVAHALWRRKLHYPARLLSCLTRMFTQIDIYPSARSGRRVFIDH